MNQPYNESTLVQGGTKSDNLKVMEEKQLLETAEIDENDWEQTPVSVRNLVVKLFDPTFRRLSKRNTSSRELVSVLVH